MGISEGNRSARDISKPRTFLGTRVWNISSREGGRFEGGGSITLGVCMDEGCGATLEICAHLVCVSPHPRPGVKAGCDGSWAKIAHGDEIGAVPKPGKRGETQHVRCARGAAWGCMCCPLYRWHLPQGGEEGRLLSRDGAV